MKKRFPFKGNEKFNQLYKNLTSLSFFVESPDFYEGGEFHTEMNSLAFNKAKTNTLIKDSNKIEQFKHWDIYKYTHPFYEENVYFYLVKNGVIEGATEISTKKDNNFCLGVWQRNTLENKGLMRLFYIEYLPRTYSSIVSDKTANKYGLQFWEKLLKWFSENNYKISVLRGNISNEEPYQHSNFKNYWTTIEKDTKSDPTFVSNKNILFKIYFK